MITYDYYRIFYYVAKYKSFTKAAEILHNNQPNITRTMNNLEQELECKLFLRSNRGITLTPEGEKLYRHVAIAHKQLTIAEEEIRQDRNLENGTISVSASETALRLLLLNKLETFREKYPKVRIRILNHSTPEAIRSLEANLIDFAVVTTPLKLKNSMIKIPLTSFREILICGPKYKYLTSREHSLNDLADIPLITLSEGTGTYKFYNRYYIRNNIPFNTDMEVATTDQVLPMIMHNMGIGFFPEELAGEALALEKIFRIELTQNVPEREICLVVNKNSAMSSSVRKITEFLKEPAGL